ncbi:MAG: DUF3127 domain-containing protein [Prevotellaceae bacterium]|nr:DUF3127 domain-containing protein [Prevotellaceae bacterium]MDO4931624.1 DUF3127 domain-containing protein [Prevotellaceae bacterium]
MELQGKVIAAMPERSGVSQRGEWKSQEFVIETHDSPYSRKLVFTVFGADRLQRFNIQVGQEVLVAFDIDAHEWNGRWFNDIRAFDVRQVDASQYAASSVAPVAQQPVAPAPAAGTSASQPMETEDGPDDLPF